MTTSCQNICLLNDAFPPEIDGVTNTVVNYGHILQNLGHKVCVATPEHPDAHDEQFPFPVIRYPSIDLRKTIGYTAGVPFAPKAQEQIALRQVTLLHSHCPASSNFLAYGLAERLDAPFVMTYHTRYELDIANITSFLPLQQSAIKAVVASAGLCDELWAVSDGAGRSLQKLGYEGDYIVMPNGVDMPLGKTSESLIHEVTAPWDLPPALPVFLFVGRLMWYKGIDLILDALAALSSLDLDYRMVFVGQGANEEEIKARVTELGLQQQCVFVGAEEDRSRLAAWYSRANLLVFPSTFDTFGLVVREAAACSCPALLVKGSDAAEGVVNLDNGLLADNTAASIAACLARVMDDPESLARMGARAANTLYRSWDTAVKEALERYAVVMENHQRGDCSKSRNLMGSLLTIGDDMFEVLNKVSSLRNA